MSIFGTIRSNPLVSDTDTARRSDRRFSERLARVGTNIDIGTTARETNRHALTPMSSRGAERASDATVGAIAKRVLDIVVAATMLVLLMPLLLITALLVRLSMGSGVIFTQERVGRGGQPFACFKFRTMRPDAEAALAKHLRRDPAARIEWETTRKLRNDPRITPIGHVLRKTSFDELPQLWNVLRGEMSCVGPRPVVKAELPRYGEHVAEYMSVRPGLTGLWQVSGRNELSYAERVALDADYVRRWSFRRDIVILFRTIPALMRTERAS